MVMPAIVDHSPSLSRDSEQPLQPEQHEEWAHGRRYLTMEAYFRWKAHVGSGDKQPNPPLLRAASAGRLTEDSFKKR